MAVALTDSAIINTDLTTYTFSSQSLGAADANRQIVVAVTTHRIGALPSAPAVTVAGAGASLVVHEIGNPGSAESLAALYIAPVPTGITGDVVVTFSSLQLRCAIAVYRMVLDVPKLTDTDSDLGGSLSLDVEADGDVVGVIYDNSNNNTFTWSGLTEDVDAALEGPASYSAASLNAGSASSPLNISVTPSGTFGNGVASVAASWREGRVAAVGAATGDSTVTATAEALSFAVGAASGAATAQAVGAGVIGAVGTAAGTSTVSGVGFGGLRPAVGSAAGTSTAAAFAEILPITNTIGIQKPVNAVLAGQQRMMPGNPGGMSKALLKSIFRE